MPERSLWSPQPPSVNKKGAVRQPPAVQIEGRTGKLSGIKTPTRNTGGFAGGLSGILSTGLLRRRWEGSGLIPVGPEEESPNAQDDVTNALAVPEEPAVKVAKKRNWKVATAIMLGLVVLVVPLAWFGPDLFGGQDSGNAGAAPPVAPPTAIAPTKATPTKVTAPAVLHTSPTRTPTRKATASPTVRPTHTATLTVTPEDTATPLPPTETPTPVATDTPLPPTLTATATRVPPRPTATRVRTYVVRAGDSLSVIARRYGTTVNALARANRISINGLIRPGQVLIIP